MPWFIICPECKSKNESSLQACEFCGAKLPDLTTRETDSDEGKS